MVVNVWKDTDPLSGKKGSDYSELSEDVTFSTVFLRIISPIFFLNVSENTISTVRNTTCRFDCSKLDNLFGLEKENVQGISDFETLRWEQEDRLAVMHTNHRKYARCPDDIIG